MALLDKLFANLGKSKPPKGVSGLTGGRPKIVGPNNPRRETVDAVPKRGLEDPEVWGARVTNRGMEEMHAESAGRVLDRDHAVDMMARYKRGEALTANKPLEDFKLTQEVKAIREREARATLGPSRRQDGRTGGRRATDDRTTGPGGYGVGSRKQLERDIRREGDPWGKDPDNSYQRTIREPAKQRRIDNKQAAIEHHNHFSHAYDKAVAKRNRPINPFDGLPEGGAAQRSRREMFGSTICTGIRGCVCKNCRGEAGFGSGWQGIISKGVVGTGRKLGSLAGKVFGANTGAFRAGSAVSSWLSTPSKSRRLAGIGALAGFGYMTGSGDTGQNLGRALAFGVGGSWAAGRFSSASARQNMSQGFGRVWHGLETLDKSNGVAGLNFRVGGRQMWRGGLGMGKLGFRHAVGAGAAYGMLSTDTTVAGGVAGAATIYGAGSMMRGKYTNPFQKGMSFSSRVTAVSSLPLVSGGAAAGAFMNMDEGIGGMAMGAATGAALGGGTRLLMNHPMATLTTAGAAALVGGPAAEAVATHSAAQHVRDMEADGNLALALHNNRHSF